MIALNYRDNRPIYLQVKEELKRLIVSGILAPGEKLPSVRSLATSLAINPNTIQRAYEALEREGYAYSVPGKGSFVTQAQSLALREQEDALRRFDALIDELLALGIPREALMKRLEEPRKGGEEA